MTDKELMQALLAGKTLKFDEWYEGYVRLKGDHIVDEDGDKYGIPFSSSYWSIVEEKKELSREEIEKVVKNVLYESTPDTLIRTMVDEVLKDLGFNND